MCGQNEWQLCAYFLQLKKDAKGNKRDDIMLNRKGGSESEERLARAAMETAPNDVSIREYIRIFVLLAPSRRRTALFEVMSSLFRALCLRNAFISPEWRS